MYRVMSKNYVVRASYPPPSCSIKQRKGLYNKKKERQENTEIYWLKVVSSCAKLITHLYKLIFWLSCELK